MARRQAGAGDGRDKTPLERWDRNLVELAREWRMA
jgi:hypothetical protein